MMNNLENFMKQNNMVESNVQRDYELEEKPVTVTQHLNNSEEAYFKVEGRANIDYIYNLVVNNNINMSFTEDPMDFVAANITNECINADNELKPLFNKLPRLQQIDICDNIKYNLESIIENDKENITNMISDKIDSFNNTDKK